MKKLFYFIIVFTFFSCNPVIKQENTSTSSATDTFLLDYAEGFEIIKHTAYNELLVYNPWMENQILARYYLIKNEDVETPSNGERVLVPLNSVAVTSSTHFEFLSLLGELEKVTGVCSPELIYNEALREKYKLGLLENLGDAFNINLEKTLELNPDVVTMSGFKQDDPYAERVMQAGLPVIYNNEWMESSLLARAEWIKFLASFFDKLDQADSIFTVIKNQYNEAKVEVQKIENQPKILTGSNFRGTWYMPGGQSFMAQLYKDSGGNYFYKNDNTKGSLPLNLETVLVNFSDSDIWLNCDFESIQDLVNADDKHKLFNPLVEGKIYNFNKRKLTSGANDFWESAVARPDLLLLDVIAILHPDLLPDYELVYAKALK